GGRGPAGRGAHAAPGVSRLAVARKPFAKHACEVLLLSDAWWGGRFPEVPSEGTHEVGTLRPLVDHRRIRRAMARRSVVYMRTTGENRTPVIRSQEELAAFRRYRATGDPALRDELIEKALPLAHQVARRYVRGGEPFDDLVQVARLGLVKAVDRFD